MKSFMREFKEFAMKGNVMDMAIGVIIGGAFGAIVNSLVNDILMPLIGILTGGNDISGLFIMVGDAKVGIGLFISSVINFIIIAFTIFVMIKTANASAKKFRKQEEEKQEEKLPEPTAEEYLKEIRDLLKDSNIMSNK